MQGFLLLLATLQGAPTVPQSPIDISSIPFPGLHTTIVDRSGLGPDTQPSVFVNMRAVLPGLVFRSGVNSQYSPPVKSPLSAHALSAACAAGFDTVYFLYSNKISTPLASCSRDGKPAQVRYSKLRVTVSVTERDVVIAAVHAAIVNGERHPILLQDIGGRHAAGYMSAIVLRQFCSMSSDEAVAYYNATDDDDSRKNGRALVHMIRSFKPMARLKLSKATETKVCPPTLKKPHRVAVARISPFNDPQN